MRYPNLLEAIGNTPLVELAALSPSPTVRLFAKLEGANPTGSVKDRIARQMVLEAERDGRLVHGGTIMEPTSGNTGIALAMIARVRGYRFVAVMPDNVSRERRQMLELYGAQIITTPGAEGSNGAVRRAQALAAADPALTLLYQYGNPANPRAHYETTAPEILRDLPEVDVFVAGLGTGGTLTGCGRRLKEHNPAIHVVAAEPLQGEGVQGLRSLEDGFIPPVLDSAMLDAKYLVHASDALRAMRTLVDREGIFAGPSGGAALHAALRVARTLERGNIVVLLADGGWKYLSEDLWSGAVDATADALEDRLLW
ncbi:MAG TPA: cysteine synthase family protein [Ktedonobacterales bacterium]|nr:cysteine synthase family protein [Ktedonobacterales bacterium]